MNHVFKKGDRVRIVKPGSRLNEATGVVEEILNQRLVCIKLDESKRIAYIGIKYVKHLNAEPKADNKSLWDALEDGTDE